MLYYGLLASIAVVIILLILWRLRSADVQRMISKGDSLGLAKVLDDHDKPIPVRLQAIEGLYKLGLMAAASPLIRALDDRDEAVRARANEALRTMEGGRLVDLLLDILVAGTGNLGTGRSRPAAELDNEVLRSAVETALRFRESEVLVRRGYAGFVEDVQHRRQLVRQKILCDEAARVLLKLIGAGWIAQTFELLGAGISGDISTREMSRARHSDEYIAVRLITALRTSQSPQECDVLLYALLVALLEFEEDPPFYRDPASAHRRVIFTRLAIVALTLVVGTLLTYLLSLWPPPPLLPFLFEIEDPRMVNCTSVQAAPCQALPREVFRVDEQVCVAWTEVNRRPQESLAIDIYSSGGQRLFTHEDMDAGATGHTRRCRVIPIDGSLWDGLYSTRFFIAGRPGPVVIWVVEPLSTPTPTSTHTPTPTSTSTPTATVAVNVSPPPIRTLIPTSEHPRGGFLPE